MSHQVLCAVTCCDVCAVWWNLVLHCLSFSCGFTYWKSQTISWPHSPLLYLLQITEICVRKEVVITWMLFLSILPSRNICLLRSSTSTFFFWKKNLKSLITLQRKYDFTWKALLEVLKKRPLILWSVPIEKKYWEVPLNRLINLPAWGKKRNQFVVCQAPGEDSCSCSSVLCSDKG